MKRIITLLLAMLMVMALAGCSGGSNTPVEPKDPYENYNKYEFDDIVVYVPKDVTVAESTLDNYKYCLDSDHLAIFGTNMEGSTIKELGFDLTDMEAILKAGMPDYEFTKTDYGYYTLYDNESAGFSYAYVALAANGKFYEMNIACKLDEKDTYGQTLIDIATKIQEKK